MPPKKAKYTKGFSYLIKKLKSIFARKKIQQAPLQIENSGIGEENILATNINHFEEKTVEDVMVPRSDISSVNVNISLEELQKVILENGHTRTIIFNENLDDIVGFVHIKDLFEVIANKKKFNLRSIIRKVLTCPHSMKLNELLKKMQHSRTHISIVIDEYGGTDGLITIENIIEELVGEIDDEHDETASESQYKVERAGVIVTNSRVEIEVIEELIGFKITNEDDENDTIGGLVMSISGNVPAKGEKITLCDGVEAEIIDSTLRVIKKLKITYPSD